MHISTLRKMFAAQKICQPVKITSMKKVELIDKLIEVKKPNLNQIINQNLGGFIDIFSIVEKNLNIVDKVQLGLACKDMHTIMKPIIKKDDIHVFHCNCFEYNNNELCEVGWQRYYGDDEKMCCRDRIEKIKEIIKDEKIKNVVLFGCARLDPYYHWNIKIDNLVTNVNIGDKSKNTVLLKKFNTHYRYEIMDVSNLGYEELRKKAPLEYLYYYQLKDETIMCYQMKVYKQIVTEKTIPSKMFGKYVYDSYTGEWCYVWDFTA